MLFEYVDGKSLLETPLNPRKAEQEGCIEGTEEMSIIHHHISAENSLVRGEGDDRKLFIIDFRNALVKIPNIDFKTYTKGAAKEYKLYKHKAK